MDHSQAAGAIRHYRDLASAPIVTAADLHGLAAAGLHALAVAGVVSAGGPMPGDQTWSLAAQTRHGTDLVVTCSGPDLPQSIPDETIRPSDVGNQIPWIGVYRMTIRAPIPVFDLYWKPAEPLRILQFSRGDWEQDLAELARAISVR